MNVEARPLVSFIFETLGLCSLQSCIGCLFVCLLFSPAFKRARCTEYLSAFSEQVYLYFFAIRLCSAAYPFFTPTVTIEKKKSKEQKLMQAESPRKRRRAFQSEPHNVPLRRATQTVLRSEKRSRVKKNLVHKRFERR